jgi:DNA-binding transcriptional regulator YdaS (Cro superfamily)
MIRATVTVTVGGHVNASQRYLDQVKTKLALPSDYALAKALGLQLSTVSNYRTGRRHLDARAAWLVAEALGIDLAEVIAAVEKDRARSDNDRDFWGGQLRRLGVAAAVLCVAHMGAIPGDAHASTASAKVASVKGYTLRYIMMRIRSVA